MGGKSRKSGGVSKALIARLKSKNTKPAKTPRVNLSKSSYQPDEHLQLPDDNYKALKDDTVVKKESSSSTLNLEILESIKSEIIFRIKITQREIMEIGGLLRDAKSICQQEKIGFQDWIKNNLGISYESAKNFMNVNKQCMGFSEIAEKIPASILYKISSPSFPEELKDYLFTQGNLKEITGAKFHKIFEYFNNGDFDAMEAEMKEIQLDGEILRHTNHHFDKYKKALKVLEQLCNKIDPTPNSRKKIDLAEMQVAHDIKKELYDGIEAAINALNQSIEKAKQIKEEHLKMLKEKKR